MESIAKIRLAVVGWRGYTDYKAFSQHVDHYLSQIDKSNIEYLVSGGARGTDQMAERYAKEKGYSMIILKPNWNKLGRGAGLARNTDIVEASTHVLAFLSPESRGTPDTINKALSTGRDVTVINI